MIIPIAYWLVSLFDIVTCIPHMIKPHGTFSQGKINPMKNTLLKKSKKGEFKKKKKQSKSHYINTTKSP